LEELLENSDGGGDDQELLADLNEEYVKNIK
jgi:hypothetical protein